MIRRDLSPLSPIFQKSSPEGNRTVLLEKEKKTLNAERIYKILKEEFLKEKETGTA